MLAHPIAGGKSAHQLTIETARMMVTRFGMSAALGPMTFGNASQLRFLPGGGMGEDRNYSERTAQAIDAEVRRILDAQYARATRLLQERREVLQQIADQLIEQETLERPQLEALVEGWEKLHPEKRPAA